MPHYTDVPIIINCRDRVTPLARLVSWLKSAGHRRIYLLDNDSAYPGLLRYYESLRGDRAVTVVRLGINLGHAALWRSGFLGMLGPNTPFVYSDPDILPCPTCPLDAVGHFIKMLLRFPQAAKAGFGLRIDDLPDHHAHKPEVIEWESRFWKYRIGKPGLGDELYYGRIDTTFALYRPGTPYDHRLPALRTGYPYLARHLPWYEDSAHPSEGDLFYRNRAVTMTHWTRKGSAPERVGEPKEDGPAG